MQNLLYSSKVNFQWLAVGLPLQNLCFQKHPVPKVNAEVECLLVALDVEILMSAAAGVSNVLLLLLLLLVGNKKTD